jgi:hypothetical protein
MEVRNQIPASNRVHGFTRVELLACLAVIALLTNVIATALAISARRGDRVACFNNLRQIGVGYSQFAAEHDQQMAWRVTMTEGGNFNHPLKNNPYVQFSVLSNYVASPRIFMDPAENRPTARVATEWGASPQGGLLHPRFANNAVSYFLGLDGNFNTPASIFSGDRNLRIVDISSCSSGITPAANLSSRNARDAAAWTNGVHGLSGNVILYDGSVHETDTRMFRGLMRPGDDIAGSGGAVYHILLPF